MINTRLKWIYVTKTKTGNAKCLVITPGIIQNPTHSGYTPWINITRKVHLNPESHSARASEITCVPPP